MRAEHILSEWKECRDTIGRFDGYLLKIRLLGVSIFTLLFTTITVMFEKHERAGTIIAATTYTIFVYALIALILFITTIYILDRYYERMLLVAVLRASRLESHQLEGFKVGLTTEIEFEKSHINDEVWNAKFTKASLMVNTAYLFMLGIVIIEFLALSRPLLSKNEGYAELIIFCTSLLLAVPTCYISNSLLKEPNVLIRKRSMVVKSPIVYTKYEIETAVRRVADSVCAWSGSRKRINVVSILMGSRQFTEMLLDEARRIKPDMEMYVYPVKIEATRNDTVTGEAKIQYGRPTKEMLGGHPTLIVDDLIDTGASLLFLKEMIGNLGIREVRCAVLVNKYTQNAGKADFIGLDLSLDPALLHNNGIKDYWLFGFGMDINGEYREIEHIGWVEKYIHEN
jgi:hypoxanthine phosphoribosyltransferase